MQAYETRNNAQETQISLTLGLFTSDQELAKFCVQKKGQRRGFQVSDSTEQVNATNPT